MSARDRKRPKALQLFDYVEAGTIAEALHLLGEAGVTARTLAGGTDILVQLRGDRRQVDRLVDIKLIPELVSISVDGAEDGLTFGAALPCCHIYEHPGVPEVYGALADSAGMIGSTQIQGRASVGGNLCNAAPSADCVPSLIVHRGTCAIEGPRGTRGVPAEEFCVAPGRTCLEDDEFLVSLHLPNPPPRTGSQYLRFIPRNEMDIAVAGVGASVTLDDDLETIVDAHIALSAVAPTPLYVRDAGQRVVGRRATEAVFGEAAESAMAAARPITDMRGTVAQRRHLVGILTRRALRGAVERARKASIDR